MRGIASLYPRQPSEGLEHLADAYRTVFSGEAGQVVLVDLCEHCKLFENVPLTAGIDMTHMLIDFNARRSVYGRILEFLRLSADELSDLERAAAIERAARRYEGAL